MVLKLATRAFVMTGALMTVSQSSMAADLNVVVTSKPIHALVAGVMRGVGTPTVLVAGSTSPHIYALKPSDVQAVNAAGVLFRVSESLEPFTGKLVSSLPKSVRVISLADAPGLRQLPKRTGAPFEAQEHAGLGHDHGAKKKGAAADRDPHVWLDPVNAKAIVTVISGVLAEIAPDHAAKLLENAAAVTAQLDALDAELERMLKPVAGRPFIVFHDSSQYLEARYGLKAAGSITVSPDVKPSAKRLSALRKKIQDVEAVCIFSESNMDPKTVMTVSEGLKARTGVLDPEATAIDAGPEAYGQLMRGMATELVKCLDGSN